MPANLENSAVAAGLTNVSFHSNPKECSSYHTIACISHAAKVMLKILQARLQQYMNREIPDVQAGFRKGRGTPYQVFNIQWIIEKNKRIPGKKIYFPFTERNKVKMEIAQLCLTFCDFYGLRSPWNSPGQNTGVGSLYLLQWIFPMSNQTGVSCVAARLFTN